MENKILIVCPCWPGLIEAYNDGVEPNGMPGFFYTLRELVNRGYSIDLAIYTPKDVIFRDNMMSTRHWFSKIKIIDVLKLKQFDRGRRIVYEIALLFFMNKWANRIIKENHYLFIYGQGNYSECVRLAARRNHIPYGMRKYGDDFAPLVRDVGKFKASLRSPLAALSYLTNKDFILATNDGTEIDKLALLFCKRPPYDIYVWNNGFEDQTDVCQQYEYLTNRPYLFQFSRVMRLKGQLEAIDILHALHKRGKAINLIIAGTIDDEVYYESITSKISSYGLGAYVHFIGKISAADAKFLTTHAVANLITGINYNINNVLIETMGYGGIPIVKETPLIDTIIRNENNGFIYSSCNDCAEIIFMLMEDDDKRKQIQLLAMKTCSEKFGTWENRAQREICLIEKYM